MLNSAFVPYVLRQPFWCPLARSPTLHSSAKLIAGIFAAHPQTTNLRQKSTGSIGTERVVEFGRTTKSLFVRTEDSFALLPCWTEIFSTRDCYSCAWTHTPLVVLIQHYYTLAQLKTAPQEGNIFFDAVDSSRIGKCLLKTNLREQRLLSQRSSDLRDKSRMRDL